MCMAMWSRGCWPKIASAFRDASQRQGAARLCEASLNEIRWNLPMIRSVRAILVWVLFASTAFAQGFTPEEALKRMQVPSGLQVRLVASEPMIRQPVTMSFDDRGRLWVLQYLQYPNPEGLKPVKVDQYLRT